MPRTRITVPLTTLALAAPALAQTSIDPAHKFSWSENCGWMNWRDAGSPAGAQGARFHGTFLSGFVWGENIGWINLGDGSPGPGGGAPKYANLAGTDFGVNIRANSNLEGLAWGENVGWINFDTAAALGTQRARFDAAARRFRGYAWGENIGWINLDDASHFVGLEVSCYADCDTSTGPGVLDIFDFLCFQNRFAATDPYACDCDTSSGTAVCDIFDFLCFQNAFAAGCP